VDWHPSTGESCSLSCLEGIGSLASCVAFCFPRWWDWYSIMVSSSSGVYAIPLTRSDEHVGPRCPSLTLPLVVA
jgi:hypothetical protein